MTVKDLQRAELPLIKDVQRHAFPEEVKALETHKKEQRGEIHGKEGKLTKRSSSIHRLNPILDKDDIQRFGGRLSQTSLAYVVKHPVLLPKKGHLTDLIVRHFQQRTSDQGRARTHAEIRLPGFWIVDGSSIVSHHISKCVTCRKLRAASQQQKMADLPSDRLEQVAPSTFSAVDYVGPFYIKEGRKELKRHGVLFTCMASRAIHLETASSLTTDSFLNAYRRFVCLRGPV